MNNIKRITLSFIGAVILSSCTSVPEEKFSPDSSYLKGPSYSTKVTNAELLSNNQQSSTEEQQRFRFVAPLKLNTNQAKTAEDVLSRFRNNKSIKITADELPLKDFLHLVLGEQLKVSYILADEVKKDTQSVTLNLQDLLSERKLFTLTEEVLIQRDYLIRVDDNIFYIHKDAGKGAKGDVIYGYGKQFSDVPQTSLEIVQLVPFEYGMQTSLGNTLKQLFGVKATPDFQRSSLTIQGKRKIVLRALEFIQLMDQPALQNRQIAIYKNIFLQADNLVKKLTELLVQEGISLGKGQVFEKALSVVTLDKQGMLVFFSNNKTVIERALFWAEQIDKPIATAERQYFIYQPQYSRAVDMGESLSALIGNGTGTGVGNTTSATSENKNQSAARSQTTSVSSDTMKMVVDERANALIFYTSGENYQQLLPLIKRLDVLPTQIMLEVMIAEVTLVDEFKSGVEFELNKGNYNLNTTGAFGLKDFGGLSYLLTGVDGNVAINLFKTNSLVNILSRPSLVVRDGVSARISIGNEIPIIGQTSIDPLEGNSRQTTQIEYRKTGIELSVTPTINAQGVVIMEIDQSISNEIEGGSTVSNSPSFFERSITTEVVAESGQTVILGGLISENRTKSNTRVPWLGGLPLIGQLFKAEKDAEDKTELVVLVTPRIIESSSEWDEVFKKFNENVTELNINQ